MIEHGCQIFIHVYTINHIHSEQLFSVKYLNLGSDLGEREICKHLVLATLSVIVFWSNHLFI